MLRRTAFVTTALLAMAAVRCGTARTDSPSVRADIIVAKDGSGQYRSINKAVSKAHDGDVIVVRPGTYAEEVEVPDDKENLTLVGSGPDKTIIDADGEYSALSLKGNGCKASGFTLTGASSHGLYVPDGHQEIENCLIYGNGDRGVYISTMLGAGTAEIRHCTIVDNDVSGIYTVDDDSRTSIVDCIVAFNNRGIVCDENKHNATIENNCLFNESDDLDRIGPGSDNIKEDPGFVDREGNNYRLKSSSPCAKAASDGRDIGCF
jgi:hypothetical protein